MLNYQAEVQEIVKNLDADKKIQERQAINAEQAKNIKLEKVAAQQEIIDKMQNDKDVYNQQYDEMQAAAQQIQRLIEESQFRVSANTTNQGYVQQAPPQSSTSRYHRRRGSRTNPLGNLSARRRR